MNLAIGDRSLTIGLIFAVHLVGPGNAWARIRYMSEKTNWTRREFVGAGLASTAVLLLSACGARGTEGETAVSPPPSPLTNLPPTPACADDDDPTPPQTAGPFYTPDAPERTSFREDGSGPALLLTGQVLGTDCRPIPGALLDFWQADANGVYDNVGYLFRGHQFADENGRYRLETVLPGLYPGRTRHIHVRVQPPNGAILTTQLYFANVPQNQRDGLYRPDLLATDLPSTADERHVTFDFVVG